MGHSDLLYFRPIGAANAGYHQPANALPAQFAHQLLAPPVKLGKIEMSMDVNQHHVDL